MVTDHGDGQRDGQHDGGTGRRDEGMGVVIVEE
jgi:hypothetical protein